MSCRAPCCARTACPSTTSRCRSAAFHSAAFGQLLKTVRSFRPDVIQAWGHTAQIVSQLAAWPLRLGDEGRVVGRQYGAAAAQAGHDRSPKARSTRRSAPRAPISIVYTSEAAASAHRRCRFPRGGTTSSCRSASIRTRFKPDLAMRRKVRERLGMDPNAFVIGMMAPFQPEYDHATLVKAAGELIKTNPNVSLLLAGHGGAEGQCAADGARRRRHARHAHATARRMVRCRVRSSMHATSRARARSPTTAACRSSWRCSAAFPVSRPVWARKARPSVNRDVAVEPGSPPAFIRGLHSRPAVAERQAHSRWRKARASMR